MQLSFSLKNSITFLYILTPLPKDALKPFLTPFQAKKKRFCYKEPLKILEGHFFSSICVLGEIHAVSRYRLISDSLGKCKSFDCLIAKVTPESYYSQGTKPFQKKMYPPFFKCDVHLFLKARAQVLPTDAQFSTLM